VIKIIIIKGLKITCTRNMKERKKEEANVSDGNAKGCSDAQVALNHRHTD